MESTNFRRKQIILGHLKPEAKCADIESIASLNPTNGQKDNSIMTFSSIEHNATSGKQGAEGVSEELLAKVEKIVSYELKEKQGAVVLRIHNPPVNALSAHVLDSLRVQFRRATKDRKCKFIIVTGGLKGTFVAGADIAEIQRRQKQEKGEAAAKGFDSFISGYNDFLKEMENSYKPTIAAVNGTCLGGGLELAMGLHARVCTVNAVLGLPELNLGLIPGFGGTQRLPRLVGVQKSLEMMLTSTPVKAKQALKLGLVNEMINSTNEDALLQKSIEIGLEMCQFKRPVLKSLYLNSKLESPEMLQQIFGFAYAQAKKRPQLTHLKACINAIKAGVELNGDYGLEIERKEFVRCATGPVSEAMIHFFFSSKGTGKLPKQLLKQSKTHQRRKIQTVGVIGGGLMGSGIAASALMAGMNVIVKEINEKFMEGALVRIKKIFEGRMNKGKLSRDQYEGIVSKLSGTIDYDAFRDCDLVIEAALEKLDLKQKIFADLEKYCKPDCILATNTSTIDIEAIGKFTRSQDRIIGLHYFSPAHVMKLLEIVITNKTSVDVTLDCLQFTKQIRKIPVVVGNCPGFTVNRVFFDYGEGAAFLLDRGVDIYRIDNVVKKFGMPMGPFRMNDMAGLDVIYHAFGTMYNAFKHRSYECKLLTLMYNDGRIGEKSGAGYYKYENGKAVQDTEKIREYIAKSRKMAGNPPTLDLSDDEIIEVIFYPTVNEACRVLEEKMAFRAADIDVASVFGMGFPVHCGGLMKFADHVGAKKIYDRLNAYYTMTGEKLFEPCNYLRECATLGKSFYEQ